MWRRDLLMVSVHDRRLRPGSTGQGTLKVAAPLPRQDPGAATARLPFRSHHSDLAGSGGMGTHPLPRLAALRSQTVAPAVLGVLEALGDVLLRMTGLSPE